MYIRCTIMYDHVRSSGYVFVGRLRRFVCFAAVGGRYLADGQFFVVGRLVVLLVMLVELDGSCGS